MSPDADRLLETDPIDPPPDAPQPAQPVVVIQYRTKAPPWLLIIGFAILAVGGWAIYDRLVVEPYRSAALEARWVLETRALRQNEPAGSEAAVDTGPPAPLAMNTQPVAGSSGDPLPSAVLPPARPESGAPAPASTTVPAPAAPPTQGVPAAVQPAAPRVPDTKTLLTEAGLLDRPASDRMPAPTPPNPPVADASHPPLLTSAGLLPAVIGPLSLVWASTQPAAPAATPAPAQDQATAERAPAESEPGPSPVAAALEPAPLPSKEENLRAIQEEAAKKQLEMDVEQRTQDAQLLALKDQERRKFLDDLSEILRLHDKQAGPEIEKLCARSGRDSDPVMLARAYRVLFSTRNQRDKVHRLRELGLSETVILDYLANELHRHRLGTRNGPRDRNEVLYQAAQLLLKYDRSAPGPARPAGPGGAPANRPAGIPAPRRASAVAR